MVVLCVLWFSRYTVSVNTFLFSALAAIKGIPSPDEECLSDAFRLALPHRLKEDLFEEAASGRKRLDGVLARFG